MLGILLTVLPLAMALIGLIAGVSHITSPDILAYSQPAVGYGPGSSLDAPKMPDGLPARNHSAPIAPLDDEEPIIPPSEINIKVEMVDEGVDGDDRWYQTLRVTINSGGTLADAAYVIYGDESYYQDLFEIARQNNPELKNPASIRAGETFDVLVDPAATYVIRETKADDLDDRTIFKFFNGGEMSVYGGRKSGMIRTIDFPDDSRASMFSYRVGAEILQVRPGSRMAEYRYRQGDAFAQIVKQIYGASSAKALQDFILRTGYTPDRWPPPLVEKKRLILDATIPWADERLQPLSRVPKGPPMNDKMKALMDNRATAGIYPLVTEDIGTLYVFQVTNPNVTARDAARLLFGAEDRYLDIANQAGIVPPTDDSGKIPEDFDPPLLGRSFELFVEYGEERFIDGQPVRDEKAARTIVRLVNGTYLEEYDRAKEDERGVHRTVYYPTGYKKVFYRADEIVYTVADYLFFLLNSGRVSEGPAGKQQQVEFIARLIWEWAPGVPREVGDIAEEFQIFDLKSGKLIEIVVAPRPQTGLVATLVYSLWLGNPLFTALSIVLLATGLIVLATVLGRSFARKRR